MTGILINKTEDREIHREEGDGKMKIEVELAETQPRAIEGQGPLARTGRWG